MDYTLSDGKCKGKTRLLATGRALDWSIGSVWLMSHPMDSTSREAQGDEEVKEEIRPGIDWTACREPVGPAGRPGQLKRGWGFVFSFRCHVSGFQVLDEGGIDVERCRAFMKSDFSASPATISTQNTHRTIPGGQGDKWSGDAIAETNGCREWKIWPSGEVF